MMSARQPTSVPAHWMPRLLNICVVNNGKAPATKLLSTVFAAMTEAALLHV